jgi:hypothetical protein
MNTLWKSFAILLASISTSARGFADSADYSAYNAKASSTSESIKIDGILDEAAWQSATVYVDFTQRLPFVGKPATEQTEFRLLYDDENLYVGIHIYDQEPDKITARTKRFDSSRIFSDDYIAVKLDPMHDRRTVYYFAVTPKGTPLDAKSLNNGAAFLTEWDALWKVAVSRDNSGWYAEFSLPFISLEYNPEGDAPIGLNITRGISRKKEEVDWAAIPAPFSGLHTFYYGHLEHINIPLKPWRRLALIPYLAGGSNDGEASIEFGADLKFPLTRNAILQATYNTDFSQTDIDAQKINFSRFSLFFPEKRKFFTEGSQFFDFGIPEFLQLFFSRRIGLEKISGQLQAVPILAGLRSYGNFGNTEYGLLNMESEEVTGAPARNFTVARVQQHFTENSRVGLIATHQQDIEGGDASNTSVGIDASLKSRNDRFSIDPFFSASHDDNGNGQAVYLPFLWRPGLWKIEQSSLYVNDDFNPAIGFLKRSGFFRETAKISRSFRLADKNIDKLTLGSGGNLFWDEEIKEIQDYNSYLYFYIENNEGYTAEITPQQYSEKITTAFDLSGQVTIPIGRYDENGIEIFFSTPDQYNTGFNIDYFYGGIYNGIQHSVTPALTLRPNDNLTLSASSEINYIKIDPLQSEFVGTVVNFFSLYSINSKMYIDLNTGWNQLQDLLTSQLRYRWRFRPLSDLFIVYKEERDSDYEATTFQSLIAKITFYGLL